MESSSSRHVIVASRADPASVNIAANLKELFHFSEPKQTGLAGVYANDSVSPVEIEEPGIFVRPNGVSLSASQLIFASNHVSSSGTPARTVHATGNPTREALYGGSPEQLSQVDPRAIKEALRSLKNEALKRGLEIEITMEATHHGPTGFDIPVMFVEIGSGPAQWRDPLLGQVAANAIRASINKPARAGTNRIGFGGTHYPAKFTFANFESDDAVGHVLSRRAFDAGISESTLRQAIDKTLGGTPSALIDWKGLNGKQRQDLLLVLEKWNIPVERC